MSESAAKPTFLTRKEAASYLSSKGYPVRARTLARMAADGRGPPYRRFLGRLTAYDRDALDAWARANCIDVNPSTKRG